MRVLGLSLLIFAATTFNAIADPCKTQGAPEARELVFDLSDDKTKRGLHAAFRLGLTPKDFPAENIQKISSPCSRGSIPLGNGTFFELRGENDRHPTRWAQRDTSGPVVFIALMPKPEPALRWADSHKSNGPVDVVFRNEDMMHAIVFDTGNNQRLVFHFFDEIPDDVRLKAMIELIITGKARWQAGFDLNSRTFVPNR